MGVFATRLKNLRINQKITQEVLAPQLGISRSTLGMYETGKREPDFETLETIADYFNVDMNYLIGYSDEPRDWERIANDEGIAPPNDYDGDPRDWYDMKINAAEDHVREENELIRSFINDRHFEELASCYTLLNSMNKDKVTNYAERLLDVQKLEEQSNVIQLPQEDKSYLDPVAAHKRTDIAEEDITDDMKQHDMDIMNNDDFWK